MRLDRDHADVPPAEPWLTTATLEASATGAPELRHVSARGCGGVTARALAAFAAGCTKLTHVDLSRSDVDSHGIAALTELRGGTLASLDVSHCKNISAAALTAAVLRCVAMRSLDVVGTKGGTPALAMAAMQASPHLIDVRLDAAVTADDAIAFIAAVAAASRASSISGGDGFVVHTLVLDGERIFHCVRAADDAVGV